MAGKKFKFPLESVLKLRQHETESARQALARCIQERTSAEEQAARARRRLDELVASLTVSGSIDPRTLRNYDAYRREAQQALEEASRAITSLKELENSARETLMARRRDEEALKTLYDQQREAFRKDQEAAEMDFLDEQAVTRQFRKRREAQA